ncbi:DNA polymerase-3 subunit alpha [Marinitoga hydrogenitolerans DSM 16785]|uniref:DNA polymerase III PolC-type n=1 Tax=Marinitoga hydrogenitolerans (strain DSM 16785 / JCM 12826 / AT1271) TaxID=1122195 RepID=A0A1M4S673_MARH1|nr:PolC-type DNA polymerase III [Marinitoga hydrogenitolerans]SHE27517.1 DNA polymerase-3 subunit alpha [Marinitoga hydrogenitolerans DSM 16785]
MKISDFLLSKLEFDPFNLQGEVEINDFLLLKLNNPLNESDEKKVKKFFSRLMKMPVKIILLSKKDLSYILENWIDLINGNEEENYLRFLLPDISENELIFRVSNKFALERVKKNRKIIDNILSRSLGYLPDYEFVFDEKIAIDYKNFETNKKGDYELSEEFDNVIVVDESVDNNIESKKQDDYVILGNKFKKVSIPLDKLNDIMYQTSKVVIEGKVFYKEYNDRAIILTMYITDNTDSIIIKAFKNSAERLNNNIKEGEFIKVEGKITYDEYQKEYVIIPENIMKIEAKERIDNFEKKRVELHAHSKFSALDSVLDVEDLVKTAAKWGHKAVAITDHEVVQSIPTFYNIAKKENIKPIYGCEINVVNNRASIIYNFSDEIPFDSNFVVFDFETTGLDPNIEEIIEFGAVKIINGEITDVFHKMVKPQKNVPQKIQEITGITNEMLINAPSIKEVLPEFMSFISDSVLVAHNANFDYRFLRRWVKEIMNIEIKIPYIDTLSMSRALLNLKGGHSLDKVVKVLGLGNFEHHRAHEDAKITAHVFLKLLEKAKGRGIRTLNDLINLEKMIDFKKLRKYHMTVLVKNRTGLKNLYKLISKAHTEYFYRDTTVLLNELLENREGLLIGSGCTKNIIFEEYSRGASIEEINALISLFDYIEIQPLDSIEHPDKDSENGNMDSKKVKEFYKLLYNSAKNYNIPVVMTGNAHYLNKEDKKARDALIIGSATKGQKKKVYNSNKYFRTTKEMLDAAYEIFEDKKIAEEIVIENTNKIADLVEEIKPLEGNLHPPIIEGADDTVRELTWETAKEVYGEPLPEIVKARIERELKSIINHGYAVLYLMAQKIVKKSNDDGYLVGSRGSVGSSLVATMMGITEVNPLPPHYICPECKYSEFITDGSYESGYDLPDKKCPKCGIELKKNGQDIPFETFMGFEGDKIPDIDLNFSGEYQTRAHKFIEELFGEDHVFRAGTISTVAEKTAYGYVRKYAEEYAGGLKNPEIIRLAKIIEGARRTTGQHPGGLMIVPKNMEVFDFTPIQFPANDRKANTKTTHFDYHVIHDDLVKLDALGHDDPTFLKMLSDLTGIEYKNIKMDDKKTMSIFSSSKALGVDLTSDLRTTVGTLGIPEFGTQFVRGMLEETKPKTFAALVRISGLSHGTDVWLNNARDLIVSGKATVDEVIACRDDIMNYLIHKGLDKKHSFFIMEKVRKGKGLAPEDEDEMKKNNVPEWFVNSCKKIKYLFPKAHAAAYVSMAFRIAYFKVHYPLAFYATYFSVKGDEFNTEIILKGKNAIRNRIFDLKSRSLDVKEKNELTVLEIAYEMILRGFGFLPPDIYKADAKNFIIEGNNLRIPFIKVPNLGEKAAISIVKAREEKEFLSIEDLLNRTGINKTTVETFKKMGILKGLPEKNQVNLFEGLM